jgi:spore germination protein KC
MRFTRAGLIVLLLSFLLTGCWGRTELNELSITSATAIDREKDKWTISYQVIIPSAISGTGGLGGSGGGGATGAPVVVYSVTSDNIREAASLSHLETARKLYIAHNATLILSEKAAREGLSAVIDIYLRNHETRETISVLVTPGDARPILEQLMSIERIPGQGIQRLLEKEQQNLSYLPNVKMYELAMDMTGESKTGLLPEIIISGTGEITSVDKLKNTSQPSKLKLGRLAVIHENKMIGWLNQAEALGTSFLRNKVQGTSIPFSCSEDKPNKKTANYLLTGSKTKITPKLEGDSFSFQVEIKMSGRLNEADCSVDLLKPETVKMLEDRIAKEIEQTTQSSWEAVKRLDADVIGLSSVVMRKYPKQWKRMKVQGKKPDWKSMQLSVKAEVKLDRIGLSNKAFKKMTEE